MAEYIETEIQIQVLTQCGGILHRGFSGSCPYIQYAHPFLYYPYFFPAFKWFVMFLTNLFVPNLLRFCN